MSASFEPFGLSPELRRAIADLGYVTPTPVQSETIPEVLAGCDVIVQSRTGTGKTAAFGIPMIERIDVENAVPQGIVLCPTRELALQVSNELSGLARHRGVRVFPIYGGASMRKQIDALEAGLHIVVGTPGRVLDHLRSRHLNLSKVRFLVLDEADEMLSMGFYEEVSRILERVPRERQTMLFSATLPPGVEGLVYRHQKEPKRISLSSDNVLVEEVHHAYYVTPSMDKSRNLARILLREEPRSAIIFVNTRDEARVVTGYLQQEGFEVAMMSGEMSQADRERVMRSIKQNKLRFMVATDVAARGIDITDLSHVINYSVPENRDVYVHRSGRTGRIGKTGTAITLVGLRDLPRWGDLEAMKGLEIEERPLPTDDEVIEKHVDRVISAFRHLVAGSVPPADDAVAPAADAVPPESGPPPALEAKYRIAGERLLEQGLSAEELGFLLQSALAPPPALADELDAERPVPLHPVPEREMRERPMRERPMRERPMRERPMRERPMRERPMRDRSTRERSAPDRSAPDRSAPDRSTRERPTRDFREQERPEQERPEPVRTEPVRTEPVRTEPVRTEPVRPERVRTEPVRTEPVRTEPVRTQQDARPQSPGEPGGDGEPERRPRRRRRRPRD